MRKHDTLAEAQHKDTDNIKSQLNLNAQGQADQQKRFHMMWQSIRLMAHHIDPDVMVTVDPKYNRTTVVRDMTHPWVTHTVLPDLKRSMPKDSVVYIPIPEARYETLDDDFERNKRAHFNLKNIISESHALAFFRRNAQLNQQYVFKQPHTKLRTCLRLTSNLPPSYHVIYSKENTDLA
jgi:hypothetical protein